MVKRQHRRLKRPGLAGFDKAALKITSEMLGKPPAFFAFAFLTEFTKLLLAVFDHLRIGLVMEVAPGNEFSQKSRQSFTAAIKISNLFLG